jgi:hypothetical protein
MRQQGQLRKRRIPAFTCALNSFYNSNLYRQHEALLILGDSGSQKSLKHLSDPFQGSAYHVIFMIALKSSVQIDSLQGLRRSSSFCSWFHRVHTDLPTR